ncbi:MAG: hypothetical protein IH940_05635 [Acidobacteria bacterium]|nr:hypothetical protein [Acidobacteriota bacterium]
MVKGKWAQGIQPRNFTWVLKDRLAICERPGGYGPSHRRVRRQEEIIWIRESEFTRVVSIIPASHNLHNYSEMALAWNHLPVADSGDIAPSQRRLYELIHTELAAEAKLLVHGEELGDRVGGLVAGYLLWSGLVSDPPEAAVVWEQLVKRRLGPLGRSFVADADKLDPPGSAR